MHKLTARRDLTIRDLANVAAAIGARVTERHYVNSQGVAMEGVDVDARSGKVWDEAFLHTISVEWPAARDDRARTRKAEAIDDALRQMARGVEDCGDDDCEVCHPALPCDYCWRVATHERTLPEDAAEHPDPKASRYLYCSDHAPADATPLPPGDSDR